MLDVHPPDHPAHSWRDFFIHMGTICLGLLIAIGLEQTVEYLHRQSEVREARRALDEERETNRVYFAANVKVFRARVALYYNNLLVLHALQQHPGTPDSKLPGTMAFFGSEWEGPQQQAWEAMKQSGLVRYLPREFAADSTFLYGALVESDKAVEDLWAAENKAARYRFMDARLEHLTPKQIDDQIALTEECLDDAYRWGAWLDTVSRGFPDFNNGPTAADLYRNSHSVVPPPTGDELSAPEQQTKARIDPAVQTAVRATAEADRKH